MALRPFDIRPLLPALKRHAAFVKGRPGGVPTVARSGRRQEHQQRERVPESRERLVRGVRRRLGGGAGLNED